MMQNLLKRIGRSAPDNERQSAEAFPRTEVPVLNVPEIDENGFPDNPPGLNPLPLPFMKRFRFLVLDDSREAVKVAMADPLDFNTREIIAAVYGKPVAVFKASEDLLSQFSYRWYETEVVLGEDEAGEGEGLSLEEQLWDNPEQLKDMASEGPIIRLVNHLISRAVDLGASDIHIEPRRQGVQVRYRIDGVLHDQESLAKRFQAAITSRIKLMAKMNIAEMRLPQDGRIKFKMARQELDIRVSSLPTVFGESLVLRLLHKEDVLFELDRLGFPSNLLQRFQATIALPYGILLVTGPTGSGKTTTLYAALSAINQPDKKIVTVEDPVEYQLEGINQVQVQSKIGLTFAYSLRSFLRQDPDVMLVGEIRDRETAEIAIQAALTGHMVFSTLHTNDAPGAILRLEDMGVERFMITSAVVAVLAQRLVRKICPDCREEVPVSDEERQALADEFGVSADLVNGSYWRGKGCDGCGGTGYRGRLGIFEFLPLDEAIQREILRGADRVGIAQKAVESGMTTLRLDGLDKVRRGITTYEEVLRVTR